MANVIRLAKLRPLTGSCSTSSGETLTPMRADDVSITGDSALTCTVSATAATLSDSVWLKICPMPRTTSRVVGWKPSRLAFTV